MNIQVFGTKKCKKTSKAERFFKERGVKIHFVNLSEKAMSKGELTSVLNTVSIDDIIDKDSKEYEKRNLHYMKYDAMEELLLHPLLINTPVVRFGKKSTVGLAEDVWKSWVLEIKA